jgi:sigma-E factor negative regulatory protein RseA
MNDHSPAPQLAESLSALMDNQASELELQRLLKATQEDADLKAAWSRYHLARSVMKKEAVKPAPGDLAARIYAALEAECAQKVQPAALANTSIGSKTATAVANLNDWWANLGRVAVAASVAAAVIIGVQQFQQQPLQTGDLVASRDAVSVQPDTKVNLPSGINAPELTARTVAVQSGFESRPHQNRQLQFVPRQAAQAVNNDEISAYVNELMEVHSDNAARNSGQGVLPFTRVILTEDE